MTTEQLSIFMENRPGSLSEVADTLREHNINIRALSLADTSDFGVLRLITNHPEEARKVLTAQGFSAQVTKVLAVQVPDKPGGLSRLLKSFDDHDVNVEYMYAFVNRPGQEAIMIFRLDDPAKGASAVSNEIGRVVPAEEIYNL